MEPYSGSEEHRTLFPGLIYPSVSILLPFFQGKLLRIVTIEPRNTTSYKLFYYVTEGHGEQKPGF